MSKKTTREDLRDMLADILKTASNELSKPPSDAQLAQLLPLIQDDVIGPEPEETIDMSNGLRGVGIWLRQFGDLTPDQAKEYLDFVIVPGSRDGRRVYRNRTAIDWMDRYVALGGDLWIMDWLPPAGVPDPTKVAEHVPELCQWAKERGAKGVMADLEPDAGWRNADTAARIYGQTLQRAASQRGLATAYTDYGRGGNSASVMRTLLSFLGEGVPQSYDPNGTYEPDYHARSEAYWLDRGAKRVSIGLGLWLRGERRHRTPQEFAAHLTAVDVTSAPAVMAWYAQGGSDHLHAILPILQNYRPPGMRPSIFDTLTPFGAAFRDWLS